MLFTIITTSILNTSCGSQKTATYWVDSSKSECNAGEAITQCLKISKGENLDNPTWEYFYDDIEGFTFKQGVFQKIKVNETAIPKKEIEADASSIKYSLVKILEEQKDRRYEIYDIWAAKKIFGKDFTTNMESPNLEINVSKMTVHGNDGCNRFSGSITNLTNTDISLGPLMATKRYCGDDNISRKFNEALHASNTYKKEGMFLVFYDNEANEMIRFIKVD